MKKRLHFRPRSGAALRLPSAESKFIRIVEKIGMTIEVIEPKESRPGYWFLSLRDPIHNHHLSKCFFERYTEQAGLVLYDFLFVAGGDRGARIDMVIGKPSPKGVVK